MSLTLAQVVELLDARYPQHTAESWDAVGLVVGDPEANVNRVHFAVDPVTAVVDEALARGADLLVTHHPLLLDAVHGVPVRPSGCARAPADPRRLRPVRRAHERRLPRGRRRRS